MKEAVITTSTTTQLLHAAVAIICLHSLAPFCIPLSGGLKLLKQYSLDLYMYLVL